MKLKNCYYLLIIAFIIILPCSGFSEEFITIEPPVLNKTVTNIINGYVQPGQRIRIDVRIKSTLRAGARSLATLEIMNDKNVVVTKIENRKVFIVSRRRSRGKLWRPHLYLPATLVPGKYSARIVFRSPDKKKEYARQINPDIFSIKEPEPEISADTTPASDETTTGDTAAETAGTDTAASNVLPSQPTAVDTTTTVVETPKLDASTFRKNVFEPMLRAYTGKNLDAFMKFYSNKFVMNDGTNKNGYRKRLQRSFAEWNKINATLNIEKVVKKDKDYEVTFVLKERYEWKRFRESSTDMKKITVVLKKLNGKWLINRELVRRGLP